ncbi:MAG: hypothetical protein R6V04_14595 [bacterium]
MSKSKIIYLFFAITSMFLIVLISSCNVRINKSIHIPDGKSVRHSLNTINGSIYIGSECMVRGNCRSVNGKIQVGRGSEISDLDAVNGSINLDKEVVVHGSVKSINGSIRCDRGCNVYYDIYTINGDIDIYNTTVEDDIKTINGDISILDNSTVENNIIIKRKTGTSNYHHKITIKISEGSVVKGDILVHHDERKVRVILSEGGRVLGNIRNAEIIKE